MGTLVVLNPQLGFFNRTPCLKLEYLYYDCADVHSVEVHVL